ncbi:type II toxin-antitoxin system RelE/ParE family toxin [Aromatoleum toluolicum]|nr:type II toxin-antitoxin system RelE/ParE family toxin [Aromatoleum toluolicum]NMF99543.2 type II toxin-antitoxin system RelE/ParE family toxin [Aromatoleum toluolicum]
MHRCLHSKGGVFASCPWSRGGRGKSGGVRVIYYFHSEAMPLYLLTLVAKNERANLSKAERNTLAELVDLLVSAWQKE